MEKHFLGQEEIEKENGEDIRLSYYLLKSMKLFEEIDIETITYGIEVLKEELIGTESCIIEDITTDKEKIEELIQLVKRNKVTPIHLSDIVADLL